MSRPLDTPSGCSPLTMCSSSGFLPTLSGRRNGAAARSSSSMSPSPQRRVRKRPMEKPSNCRLRMLRYTPTLGGWHTRVACSDWPGPRTQGSWTGQRSAKQPLRLERTEAAVQVLAAVPVLRSEMRCSSRRPGATVRGRPSALQSSASALTAMPCLSLSIRSRSCATLAARVLRSCHCAGPSRKRRQTTSLRGTTRAFLARTRAKSTPPGPPRGRRRALSCLH
mmetsp:Transcript_18463/g.50989  ORF Transcript_18463/g.50989 Transcript_18463/m.50989 type:complete len:223 (-) Transcript_18463:123-791(-)